MNQYDADFIAFTGAIKDCWLGDNKSIENVWQCLQGLNSDSDSVAIHDFHLVWESAKKHFLNNQITEGVNNESD